MRNARRGDFVPKVDGLWATLAHLGIRDPDPEKLAAFYEDAMGLSRERDDEAGIRLGWGAGHHVLEIAAGPHGFDHVAFEVPRPGDLEQLVARLRGEGVEVSDEAPPDHPACAVLADPDGNRVELLGRVDRSAEHVADPGRRPIRVQHVTLGSPDVGRMVAFYSGRLGFRISDELGENVFTWMRSDHAHHTLAVVHADQAELDHYSYDVGGWADFKTWCDELSFRGWEVAWGPGRHGPGNNLFIIFEDVAGFRVELSAEMEQYWDELAEIKPRRWEQSRGLLNLWGPMPSWRQV
jgi:catechol-2,3-dioxygenase